MRKLLSSEEFLVIIFSLILLTCSYGPLVYRYLTPPPGKTFLGVFGFPPDFYGNLIAFQEGRAGLWQHLDKTSSTTSGPPVWLKFEYRLLGRLSRLLPIDITIAFHLSRFLLSLILILVSYQLISTIFKKKHFRLCAFLLVFFSTAAGVGSNNLIVNWTPLSVFQRAAYFQHYLLSFIFILLTILFLNQAFSTGNWRKLFLAAIFGFLSALIHAFSLISLFLTLPFYFIFDRKKTAAKYLKLVVFCFLSALPLVYQFQVSQFRPWSLFPNIELHCCNLINNVGLADFIFGIGPTLFLGLIGAFWAIKKNGNLNLLLAPWAIVYLAGFWFLWRFFDLNSARFLQTPFYIILGILSVFAIEALSGHRPRNTLIITLLVLLLSLPAWQESLKINQQFFVNETSYASPDYLEALNWLQRNGGETDVFLSGETNGMIIAARAGLMPYLATFSGTLPTYKLLQSNVKNFYSGQWDGKQVADFVKTERIKYVFFGPEERIFNPNGSLSYRFLKKTFENSEVAIFQESEL